MRATSSCPPDFSPLWFSETVASCDKLKTVVMSTDWLDGFVGVMVVNLAECSGMNSLIVEFTIT